MTPPQDPIQQLWQQHTRTTNAVEHRPIVGSRHALHRLQQRMRRERLTTIAYTGALILCLGYPQPAWHALIVVLIVLLVGITVYNAAQSRALYHPRQLALAPRVSLVHTLARLRRYLRIYRFTAYLMSALPLPLLLLAAALDHPALPRQSVLSILLEVPGIVLVLGVAGGLVLAQRLLLERYIRQHYAPHLADLAAQLRDWEQAEAQLN